MTSHTHHDFLRRRVPGEQARVEFSELFFDLVFVFAVTQVSHTLLGHLSLEGAVQALMLLLAMWWVWNYTAWATNWLDPSNVVIRLMLFVLMLAGLIFSISIPEAFGERGLAFAGAYVFMQVGRCLFTVWAMKSDPENRRNFIRITSWQVLGGIFWIAGAFLETEPRMLVWAIALLIEYVSPKLSFWTPWLGASRIASLTLEGGHMAERAGLFIIIALGESILVTGATFSESDFSGVSIAAFLIAFVGSVAMWWIYFNSNSERAHEQIAASPKAGLIANVVYTYIHTLIVAGIIVSAVGDELVLAHPAGHHAELPTVLVIVGGPALYLLGTALFRGFMRSTLPLGQTVALVALVLLGLAGGQFEPLVLAGLVTLLLVAIAAWDGFDRKKAAMEA